MVDTYARRKDRRARPKRFGIGLALCSITVVLTLFEPLLRSTLGGSVEDLSTVAPIDLGVRTTGAPENLRQLDDYAERVGGMPAIVMWYQSWEDRSVTPFDAEVMSAVADRDATPMITWEPWDPSRGVEQPEFSLAAIGRGDHDDYIRRSARDAAAWGAPFYLRFGHEMNGTWYPWGRDVNGNTPEEFASVWQRIVGIFWDEGASNAIWVWSPNVNYLDRYPFRDLYPGDDWVDWVGLDGYNWGDASDSGWQSFAEVFGESYETVTDLTDKPVMITETASSEAGGDKADWIRQGLLDDLPAMMPLIRAVIWFDRDKEQDWRVNSSKESLDAYQDVVASPLYRRDDVHGHATYASATVD